MGILKGLAILFFLVLPSSVRSTQFANVTTDDFPGAPQTCLDAVNTDISCTGTLAVAKDESYNLILSNTDLNNLCTDSCFNSLQNHKSSVASSCGAYQFLDSITNTYFVPTILDDQLLYAFNSTCIKSGATGQYCDIWYQNVENGTSTASDCDTCLLQSLQLHLNSPVGENSPEVSSYFASLTSSCQSTQFATTSPSKVIVTSVPTPTSNCTGSYYTIKSGDTADSIALAQKVSTNSLLNVNGLSYNNTGFPTSGQLCIENTCSVYQVKANDTCRTIAASTNATTTQLISWNVNINSQCSNLDDTTGDFICVSNPAGNYARVSNTLGAPSIATTAAPIPMPTGANTTSRCGQYYQISTGDICQSVALKFNLQLEDFYFLNPELNGNCTNLQLNVYYCVQPVGVISTYPGYGGTTTTAFVATDSTPVPNFNITNEYSSDEPVIPVANDSRADCSDYFWISTINANTTLGDCWMLALTADIDREQLILWNPSLAENGSNVSANTTYDYPCTISASKSYCVGLNAASTSSADAASQTPSPRAAGEISGCTTWIAVETNLTCQDILINYELTIAQFYNFNPTVKSDCSGLFLGTNYCISTDPNGLPPQSNATTTSTTSSTSSGPTGVVTPTPTQSGMVAGCNKFYDVKPNDGCYDIAANNSIALADFYSWNPAVKTDCSGLQPNYYVCVGRSATSTTESSTTTTKASSTTGIVTPTPTQTGMITTCNKFYDVIANDGCYDIAAANQIALADFYSWNPAVKTDCSGLQAGVYVCVGIIPASSTTANPSTTTSGGVVTPTPTQAGMITTCKKFYDVVPNDGCYDIAAANQIALADFYTWNPAVKNDCSGLQPNYYVCVGI